MTVTVYSTPNCPKCMVTAKQLDKLVEAGKINGYNKIDVTKDDDAVKLLESKGFGRGTPMPVVNAGDEWWSDLRVDRIKALAA